ncbi:MAG: sialidase family protein [Ignavibacteriaceae bacterium]|nr:sialidase family protein [Ignavibacteriaceae bacterium]
MVVVVYVVTNSGSAFASTYTFYASTNGGLNFTLKSAQNFSNYVGTNVGGRNSVQNMRTRPYPFITADQSTGPNRGRLYLVYASNDPAGNGNKPDIFCRYSTDQGVTWSTAVKVNDDPNTTNHNQWHPSIWCDVGSGRLFVKWMDTRDTPTSDSAYIYASYSDNGGVTWAANQRISNQKMRINCTTCGGRRNSSLSG